MTNILVICKIRRRRETPNFLHTLSNTNVIKKNISVPASTPILHFDPRTKFFRKGASGFLIAGIVLLEQRCKYLHVYRCRRGTTYVLLWKSGSEIFTENFIGLYHAWLLNKWENWQDRSSVSKVPSLGQSRPIRNMSPLPQAFSLEMHQARGLFSFRKMPIWPFLQIYKGDINLGISFLLSLFDKR